MILWFEVGENNEKYYFSWLANIAYGNLTRAEEVETEEISH